MVRSTDDRAEGSTHTRGDEESPRGSAARLPKSGPLRVVLTGAECTGKTSLCNALSGQFGWPVVPEAARVHAGRVGRSLTRYDLDRVVREHVLAERLAVASARSRNEPVLLLDTDLVSALAYAEHYHAASPRWLRDVSRRRSADLYLLCQPDFLFEPEENQRGSSADRLAVQDLIRAHLIAQGLPWTRISGPALERIGQAEEAIRNYLPRPNGP